MAQCDPDIRERIPLAVFAHKAVLLKPTKALLQLTLSRYGVVDTIRHRDDVC